MQAPARSGIGWPVYWVEPREPEAYDAARDRVGWEDDAPDGFVMHMGWFADDGFHAADVWETEDHFTRFIADRVAPVVKGELGITTEPQVTFAPLYRRFIAPDASSAA